MMEDLSFLGLDEEKTRKVYAFILRSVSAGIDEGAQKVVARYESAIKWHFGASVATAALAAAMLIVLLARD